MSNADWYARRLGQPAPPQRSATPPASPPAPYRVPPVPQHSREQQPEVKVTTENLAEAASLWHGGQGTADASGCPNCNSPLFFSRSNGTSEAGGSGARLVTQNGIATVAPRCFACGYSPATPMQTGAM